MKLNNYDVLSKETLISIIEDQDKLITKLLLEKALTKKPREKDVIIRVNNQYVDKYLTRDKQVGKLEFSKIQEHYKKERPSFGGNKKGTKHKVRKNKNLVYQGIDMGGNIYQFDSLSEIEEYLHQLDGLNGVRATNVSNAISSDKKQGRAYGHIWSLVVKRKVV